MRIHRPDIIRAARTYLGTPYHHQGRVKGLGVDCVGLVACVMRDFGIRFEDCLNYSAMPDGKTLEAEMGRVMSPITLPAAGVGDVLVLRMGRFAGHVGFMSHDHYILHTYSTMKKVVEHRIDREWERRLVGAYQFPGAG